MASKNRRRFVNHKRKAMIFAIFFLILFITVGYAYLSASLSINGNTTIASNTWDIHFANLSVSSGSASAITDATIQSNTTSINYAVELGNLEDFYEFEVDIVNAGTIPGKVSLVNIQGISNAAEPYLESSIKYTNGNPVQVDDLLNPGSSKRIVVRVGYIEDLNSLPEDDIDLNLVFTISYVQTTELETTTGNLLQNLSSSNSCITKYEGQVTDQVGQTVTASNVYFDSCEDKRNVIFANHCWQVVRTTETGGLKMIYNGEAVDNQCLSTRGTHVGYASRTSQNLASNYWYGTDYTYDSAAKTFKVSGTTEQTMWNESNGPGLVGKYTCKLTSEDGTCATLYLVESYYNTSNAYVIPLNSNSNYSQFGTLQFNASSNSPSYVGYMYNTVYPYQSKTMTSNETMLSSSSLATTYWYAHDAIWGSPTASRYNLDSPYQVSATTDYPNLVGEYTFRNATQTYTYTSVYYIAAVNNITMYYIQLSNSGNHTLSDFNYTYTYGDSFTDNGDGTYTINNPTTINRSDWYTNYSSVGANKYVCKNAVNNTCSDLWYTTATSTTSMTYIKVANNYMYSKGFTWDGSKYVLDDNTSTTFWNINDSTNKTSINNAHYTCWNSSGECTTISYIYYFGTNPFYINITNGKSVEDAKNEMLYNNDVNTINSIIKTGVDAWYKHYLSDYSDYLEDTIFCNDRSQRNQSTNGWNPNGGSNSTYLYFYGSSDLSCPNDTDKFSVSNNKAKLIYKVGLISFREMDLLNNSNARKTGQYYWLGTPGIFEYNYALEKNIDTSGSWSNYSVSSTNGVRPAVSLKSEVSFSGGTGSEADPWIVE